MAEIKCPCGLRNHMEEEDCKKTNCNACCPLTKPQTNADRIRAMSDEGLAIFVRAVVISDGCPNGDVDCKECPAFAICNQSGLYGREMEWLKQPAE